MNSENPHPSGIHPTRDHRITSFLIMNGNPTPKPPEHSEKLVHLFKQMVALTSKIQIEISEALLENPANRDDVAKQLQRSENDMQLRVNKAVYAFVGAMPLGSANRQNLFMEALALHANLTGNTLVHDLIHEVNLQTLAEDPEYNT